MAESYQAALARASKQRLTASPEPWGQQVFNGMRPIPSEGKPISYPYVVCTFVGGGNQPLYYTPWVRVLWQIRATAKSREAAYACQARIDALFTDADNSRALALDGGTDWEISTCTQLDGLDVAEPYDSNFLYHAGYTFRVVMQRK